MARMHIMDTKDSARADVPLAIKAIKWKESLQPVVFEFVQMFFHWKYVMYLSGFASEGNILAYQDYRQTHWNECACHPASPNIQSMAGYRVSSLNHCGVITLVFISIYNSYNTYSLVVGSQMTKSLSPALREPQILDHTFSLPFPENRQKKHGLFLCLFSRFIIDLLIFELQTSNPSQGCKDFGGCHGPHDLNLNEKIWLFVFRKYVYLLTCYFLAFCKQNYLINLAIGWFQNFQPLELHLSNDWPQCWIFQVPLKTWMSIYIYIL